MNIQSKLPNVGTTIFTVMSQMAIDNNAINLGQGFPDFNPHPELVHLVSQAMEQGHNQYAAMSGVPALRHQISKKIKTLYGHYYDPDTEITVTSGATEALMATILALVNAGDEVIVIEPVYDLYIPAIALAGGIPVVVPMIPPNEEQPKYSMDWQRVRDSITAKTRMIILNFPHNPTGNILAEHELDILESIVHDTGILILSDEAYEHIVFDGEPHRSISTRRALANNAIVVFSFGKTFHTTGWKIGYCTAPAKLTTEIRKVHQFSVFSVNTPMQYALGQFLENPQHYMNLSGFYQAKRDYFSSALATSRFKPLVSQGTFFLLADYSSISNETEMQFAQKMTKEHGVTAIPMAAFYQNPEAPKSNHGLVRLCFAKQNATLDAALERLKQI